MLGEKIEDQDNKLVLNPDRETLKIINMFKRQLTDLGRYIKPAREMISSMVKMDSVMILIAAVMLWYFKRRKWF